MSKSIEERQAAMRERHLAAKLRLPVSTAKAVLADIPPDVIEPRPKKTTFIVRPWPALLTIDVAADYAGVSRTTINEWMAEGKIRPHVLPGIRGRRDLEKIVFERSQFERFLGLRPE